MNNTTFQGDGKIVFVPVVVNSKQHKQTNADRLRAMTDEELAEAFETLQENASFSGAHCSEYWLSWLKATADKEVEE